MRFLLGFIALIAISETSYAKDMTITFKCKDTCGPQIERIVVTASRSYIDTSMALSFLRLNPGAWGSLTVSSNGEILGNIYSDNILNTIQFREFEIIQHTNGVASAYIKRTHSSYKSYNYEEP
jgi:hypothetical protein